MIRLELVCGTVMYVNPDLIGTICPFSNTECEVFTMYANARWRVRGTARGLAGLVSEARANRYDHAIGLLTPPDLSMMGHTHHS